jgi:hypothetical protein
MKQNNLELIREKVKEAKNLPNGVIEYNMELPNEGGITSDNFFGVKAIFNKNVSKQKKINITYHY